MRTLLVISLCITALLSGLSTASRHKVKLPGGSRTVNSLVSLGLGEYISPLVQNALQELKTFSETEQTRVVAEKDNTMAAYNQVMAARQTLNDLLEEYNNTEKVCNDTIQAKCPNCIAQQCEQRATEVCPQPTFLEAIRQLADKQLNPCGCPFYDPSCKVTSFFCSSKPAMDLLSKAINPIKSHVIDPAGNFFHTTNTFHDAGDFFKSSIPDFFVDGVPKFFDDTFGGAGDFFKSFDKFFKDGIPGVDFRLPDFALPKLPVFKPPKLPDFKLPDFKLPDFGGLGGLFGRRKRAVDGLASPHHPVYRRNSPAPIPAREPTCDELKDNIREACGAYAYLPHCKASCNATHACPGYQALVDRIENAVAAFKAELQQLNKSRALYQQAIEVYRQQMRQKQAELCWQLDFVNHQREGPSQSRLWYSIKQLSGVYDGAIGQFVDMTASIDVGSDRNRFQGDIRFPHGFRPIGSVAARRVAEEALEWYKQKLIDNGACQ